MTIITVSPREQELEREVAELRAKLSEVYIVMTKERCDLLGTIPEIRRKHEKIGWRAARDMFLDETKSLRESQVQMNELKAKLAEYEKEAVISSQAKRLALELECLLLSTKDTAASTKWWDTAHEALQLYHNACMEVYK